MPLVASDNIFDYLQMTVREIPFSELPNVYNITVKDEYFRFDALQIV